MKARRDSVFDMGARVVPGDHDYILRLIYQYVRWYAQIELAEKFSQLQLSNGKPLDSFVDFSGKAYVQHMNEMSPIIKVSIARKSFGGICCECSYSN